MNDTPETDAFFMREDIDWDMEYDLCRKLERERNEWKEVAEGSLLGAIHERDEAKDNVRKLAVSLADSIRFSLARQDETEEAMHECSELRIIVDGLLEMNQKLSDERNSHYNELLTKRGLCKVQEQVITDWKSEAEKWRAIANDNRD